MSTRTDVKVQNEGSIFLFHPLTKSADAWIEEHVAEGALYYGNALVVEHRYALDVAQGMLDDGLIVK